MKTTANHPDWALKHKRPGTELKLINGRYYLYGVKSVYDKTAKRSRKVSLGIQGSITQEKGFIPSEKAELKRKSVNTYLDKQVMVFEYGFARWFLDELEGNGFAINDAIEHLKSIKQIKFAPGEFVISEMNKSTKILLKQMKISIT